MTAAHSNIEHPFLPPVSNPVDNTDGTHLREKLAEYTKTYKRLDTIPKSARPAVAVALADTLSLVHQNNDAHSWANLLVFAHTVLRAPSRKQNNLSWTTYLRDRIEEHRSGSGPSPELVPRKHWNKRPNEDKAAARRATRLLGEGDIGGAARALLSVGSPVCAAEAFVEMTSKHPSEPADLDLPPT